MSYEDVISFGELYDGLKNSCKGVRWKDSVVRYENDGLQNTLFLQEHLRNQTYQIDEYQQFLIYEPKKREIMATRLKDRQFQHSLCENGFYEEITKSFIADNCACLKGRGVDYCINRVSTHLRKYYQEYGNEGWVLKCDIRHYFQSIPHDVAKNAVKKRVKDKEIVQQVYNIIDSFGEKGLGLGSQVSQLVALAVLDNMDHNIKEKMKIKHYVRYMDDFILIHPDKNFLRECWGKIETLLSEIGLELNGKTALYPLKQGIKMLQWKFILTDTGKVIKKMDKKKISHEKKKLNKLLVGEKIGKYKIGTAKESLCAFNANAKRGNTYFIQINMINYFKQQEEIVYGEFIPKSSQTRSLCSDAKNGLYGNFEASL